MKRQRALAVIAAAALGATSALTAGGIAVAATDWGPVVTVSDHGFENLSSVTTDNGMVVATWSGPSFGNVWMAVRPAGRAWSNPKKIVTAGAGLSLAKDGKGAWIVYQGFESVSAVHVDPDGSLGSPDVIGPSSDPFISDAQLASGTNGAVAAAWHQKGSTPLLAYRPAGGQWSAAENVPVAGGLVGVVVGAKGAAQLALSNNQGLVYMRRSAGGVWGAPVVVSGAAKLATATGNAHGDMVFGWQIDNGNGTFVVLGIAADGAISLGSNGAITLVWGRGCHPEECNPTRLVAQRGR